MSWGYWGIVGTLIILVSLTLVCVMFLTPRETRSLPPKEKMASEAGTAVGHASGGHRQAA
ncbi:MAG: hypothetical protein NNA18_04610 [Nitrospira sp.]|nr:hypothetical protein [Nitrospira sp.]